MENRVISVISFYWRSVFMNCATLLRGGMTLFACVVCLLGCGKKAKAPPPVSPHSSEGVLLRLKDQARLFQEAYARNDYAYLHDWGFYFRGAVQAFASTLNYEQKQRLRGTLDELARVGSQLDSASGRAHSGATEATVQRIQALMEELDKKYHETKTGG